MLTLKATHESIYKFIHDGIAITKTNIFEVMVYRLLETRQKIRRCRLTAL